MNLNFDSHISNIAYKISKTIRIISKIRYYLLEKALLKIYHAGRYISSFCTALLFGNPFFPTYLKKLTTLQNRSVRYIFIAAMLV